MPSDSDTPNGLPWFAIQTRPRWEKFVHQALGGKGYEAFLPLYTSRRRWSDRIKEIELPLFSGYLFCRLHPEELRLPVLTTPGVRGIVGIAKTPAPIPDLEIETVRAIVASGLAARPSPFVCVGARVRIQGGALDGIEGILVSSKKRYRLVVSVELLQRSVAVAAVSLAGMLLFLVYAGEAQVEQSMCRYLVCAEETLIESGYQAMYRSGPQNATQVLEAFREAARRDAASPERWCDLAGALTQYGQTEQARYCYNRALQLAPNSPQIWLRAANFSFTTGDNQKALDRYGRVLRITPVYAPVVFSYYGLMDLPLEEILERGVPADRGVAQSYFRLLLGAGSDQDVEQGWRWVTSRSFADDQLAGQYVEALLGRGRYDNAAEGWKQFLGERAAGYLQSTYLYNGDFEQEPTGSVFDWRLSPSDGVRLEMDEDVSHSGRRSLRVELGGRENLSYGRVSQRTVVREGAYRLRAYAKTEGLSTDRGLTVRLFDAQSTGRLDVRTDELLGTNDWRLLEKRFTVGRGTRLIEVQLSRELSLKFDNKIRGTLWLDGVTLERVEGRSGNAATDRFVPR